MEHKSRKLITLNQLHTAYFIDGFLTTSAQSRVLAG